MVHDLGYIQIITNRPRSRELSVGFDPASANTILVSAFPFSRKSWQSCSELVMTKYVGQGTLKDG
jgi:hypothetical protein